ncbi:hypothetical protein R6Z07F_017769 [Ovis aries]
MSDVYENEDSIKLCAFCSLKKELVLATVNPVSSLDPAQSSGFVFFPYLSWSLCHPKVLHAVFLSSPHFSPKMRKLRGREVKPCPVSQSRAENYYFLVS